jgi:DNA polymerase-3 subunit epsilon
VARKCANPLLHTYLEHCALTRIGDIESTPLIAVDLELTGLKSAQHEIVAIGWTHIDQGRIRMGSNRHLLIKSDQTVGPSAAIHELLDSEVAEGEDLEHGLAELFEAAVGRVWVFHHAGLDIAFLKKACQAWAGVSPGFIVLDTMRIEHRLRLRREIPVRQGELQLGRVRSTYGLPRYTAHNALLDAFATAELLLAIAARLEPDAALELEPHIKYF